MCRYQYSNNICKKIGFECVDAYLPDKAEELEISVIEIFPFVMYKKKQYLI